MRRIWTIVGIAILGVAAVAVLWSRNPPNADGNLGAPNTNASAEPGPAYGVSLSPRGPSAADFTDFVERARAAGTVLTWAGDAAELTNGSGPKTVLGLADRYALTAVLVAGVDAPTLRTAEPAAALRDRILQFARARKPAYLGLGNEINRWSEVDTDTFIRWFNDLAPQIRAASPSTKVFTTFQYENLQGRYDGLFGSRNDPSRARWGLLDALTAADLFAFTSYPGLLYHDPSDIPEGYYRTLAERTTKPVAFTEIGWFREGPGGSDPWGSSAEEQAEFILRFRSLVSTGTAFVVWPFVYDPSNVPAPFDTMGLLARDATDSPAWQAWLRP